MPFSATRTGQGKSSKSRIIAPFSTNRRGAKKSPMTDKNFAIKSFAFSEPYQPMYVPQLMMEMLCTDCQSAVMVRQTATTGALIIRLHRNDDWIKEMLYWLHQFHTQFVEPGHSPPANFFWNEPNATTTQRYRAFVRHTYELAGSVQVLAHGAQGHSEDIWDFPEHNVLVYGLNADMGFVGKL
ncbi:hypothetical protein MHU86_11115 [Fragilaria crotonensis]|nr:hypothetical protein MHU86_11115 [Fragilaria crotonensis]